MDTIWNIPIPVAQTVLLSLVSIRTSGVPVFLMANSESLWAPEGNSSWNPPSGWACECQWCSLGSPPCWCHPVWRNCSTGPEVGRKCTRDGQQLDFLFDGKKGSVISCDLAKHEKVNVSNLGQSKRGRQLELVLPNGSGAGAREMNPAVVDGVEWCVVLHCPIW